VNFRLRDFRPADLDILCKIDQKCFLPGIAYSKPELATYIEGRGAFTLVAETDGDHQKNPRDILGFLVAEAGSRGAGHIITIDVLAEARRFGVGSKLLDAAEDRLRAAQCRSVFLETAVDNQAALAFYKRHQYFLVKTLPRYYSNGVDAFVLKKELAGP
jgi:ribosomal-protein-alanine N-acetyltransferase